MPGLPMANLLTRLFGSANERVLKRLWPVVRRINELEPAMQALPPEAFPEKTAELRRRLESEEAVLDSLLPEAFALVREASRRTIGLRHFDVQCLGGMVLHQGKIAEMKTGEGKTLVATLPLYLNALTGKGAHLVTVNDYLARRDVQWMGPIYHYLGLTVGSIIHDASFLYDPTYIPKDYRFLHLRPVERREAYRADVTYGTNNEFGFDYLRDNMKFSLDEYVQRELNYAIVDEVDNILIDEARTPLIISGPAEQSSALYATVNRIILRLRKDIDYTIDEKHRNALLTEEGVAKCERLLGVANLYDPSQIDILHHVQQALRAHTLYKRDVDYVVKDGEVIIVDEFTGRLMPGRRWSDGLHQAVEAKEGVKIESENLTLATVTIQNYFRMYAKLAGMTGTADTEAVEFKKIYKLDVVVIPPNKPMRRVDYPDVVYKTEREKFDAVVDEIKACHEKGQPVLVGTTSVEKSERVSKLLKKAGIRHNVLNAINHEAEANIIAQAGRFGQVTIATNMAGRGTDILLGGNPEFLARSEMENEWIRGAVPMKDAAAGQARYEDALRQLRERYDEEVQALRSRHAAELERLEERRNQALKELTEIDRKLRELSPYRQLLARYEEVSSVELIGAVRDLQAVPERYRRARAEMEEALLGAGVGGAGEERRAFDALRARYEEAHVPYQEGLRAAERRYEAARAEYVAAVEEIREQLQKAPHEYEARYREALERFQTLCAEEREKVVAAGGLHIIGTERHEARRIDNQLRGRAGRQGDPGSSRFYLSLEDDLLRIFGADRMQGLMQRLGMEDGVPIEHRFVTRAIRNAQEKVEGHNFDIRKHLLEYDDVLNKQREVIYARRRNVLTSASLRDEVLEMVEGLAADLTAQYADPETPSEEWDWKALDDAVFAQFNVRLNVPEAEREKLRPEQLEGMLVDRVRAAYDERERVFGPHVMRHLERLIMLQTLDSLWRNHLLDMEHLKEGIGLRGYGQVNPLQAYQKEGYDIFGEMIRRLESDVVEKLMSVQLQTRAGDGRIQIAADHLTDEDLEVPPEVAALEHRQRQTVKMRLEHAAAGGGGAAAAAARAPKVGTVRREGEKVGRNDPCPCGSGRKYKKCHGAA